MTSPPLALRVLPEILAIVRLEGTTAPPDWAFSGPGLAAVLRRDDELTVVCATDRVPFDEALVAQHDWRALEVQGPLDFALTGILAALASSLAAAGIAIFALSTYDTDVLLVHADRLDDAVAALRSAGHAAG